MKKHSLLAYFIFLFSLSVVSQTATERLKIISNYDFNAIENLKKELKLEQINREKRVSDFQNKNKEPKSKTDLNGKSCVLHDVINGKPIYRSTTNIESAKATKTDQLYAGGSLGINVQGENMAIGVWDAEIVLQNHDEFKDDQTIPQSRIVYPEFNGNPPTGNTSDHATHVAGTLIAKGVNAKAKGMAPKATLRSYNWFNDDTEALDEAGKGLLISNHSYGTPIFNSSTGTQQINSTNIGAYDIEAKTWDNIAYNAPYFLAVNSAGNEGNKTYTGGLSPNYDKLTGNKTSKNNLVIANADPLLFAGGALLYINASSSQGPTDDFRIKPDISGDGTGNVRIGTTIGVFSPINTNNSAYGVMNGTSMASPNVAGSLLLLQQYYNELNNSYLKAASLKGLVCHTALDDSKIGPDPKFGWGLLDTEKAANLIKDANNGTSLISELSLINTQTYTYQFEVVSGSELKATICWTDPAGNASSSPNNVLSPRLVNDLDLRLENQNTIYVPWKLDKTNITGPAIKGDNNVDNIERIDINNPIAGTYTLTVTHKGTLTNGKQDFSLILSGNNLVLSVSEKNKLNAKIWPNPASNILNIKYDNTTEADSQITIYNIQGQKIYQDNTKSNLINVIDVSKINPGMYFLSIKNGYKNYTQKIIIE